MVHCKKTVYDPSTSEDGWRIIVMRRYPRGVAKSTRHAWLPELAPSTHLVKFYHASRAEIDRKWAKTNPTRRDRELARFWQTYSRKYIHEMKNHKQLIAFLARVSLDRPITILCSCKQPELCHRSLLAALINEAAHDVQP